MARHEPRRTCVACRTSHPQSQLFRFVAGSQAATSGDPAIQFDRRGHAPGRGAYVCRDHQCIDIETDRHGRGLLRTLRSGSTNEATNALNEARTHLASNPGAMKEQSRE